jgi:hypothetical protein
MVCSVVYGTTAVNGDLGNMGKEVAVIYFKLLPQHFPRDSEDI